MANQDEVFIVKASGKRERFRPQKLKISLKRAGARPEIIKNIVDHIQEELVDGMTTGEIYQNAFRMLKKRTKSAALKYSLRTAVMDLGPSGFPFERFVGEILKARGFKVRVGSVLAGACVDHEVDVLAEKNRKHIFVEAKFHNQPGVKTDLKVALYVQERFEDITEAHEKRAEKAKRQPRIHEGWLVTNTKLTSKAIEYSKCRGMTVIGWNYPKKGNLQDLILEAGIHPLTCLDSLGKNHKRRLLEQDFVLCSDLPARTDILRDLGFDKKRIARVMEEVAAVCTKTGGDRG